MLQFCEDNGDRGILDLSGSIKERPGGESLQLTGCTLGTVLLPLAWKSLRGWSLSMVEI